MGFYKNAGTQQKIEDAAKEVKSKIVEELIKHGVPCTQTSSNVIARGYSLFDDYGNGLKVDEIADKIRLRIKYDSTKSNYQRGWLQIGTTYVLGEKFQLGKVCDKIEEILGDQARIKEASARREAAQRTAAHNSEQAVALIADLELPKDSKLKITATDSPTFPFNVELKFTSLTKFQVLALYSIIVDSGLLGNMEKVV